MMAEIPEIEFLRRQGGSSFVGGGPTWIVGTVCHLCGDDTEKGERDDNGKLWICYDCKKERQRARADLRRTEKSDV